MIRNTHGGWRSGLAWRSETNWERLRAVGDHVDWFPFAGGLVQRGLLLGPRGDFVHTLLVVNGDFPLAGCRLSPKLDTHKGPTLEALEVRVGIEQANRHQFGYRSCKIIWIVSIRNPNALLEPECWLIANVSCLLEAHEVKETELVSFVCIFKGIPRFFIMS